MNKRGGEKAEERKAKKEASRGDEEKEGEV